MGRASPDLLLPERYSFGYELQTRFSDIDLNQHINNVAMAAAFEDARLRFAITTGIRDAQLPMRPVIVNANIDYLAEAYYPAPLSLYVAVLQIGRTSWAVAHLAIQDGKPCAFCRGTSVLTDDGRSAVLPARLRELLQQNMIKPLTKA